jgi:hypothetical protein
VAGGVHDLRKFAVEDAVASCEDDDSDGDSGFHRSATEDERLVDPSLPTTDDVTEPVAAASRALLTFTIDCTNPRPLRRLILGVGSFSFGGERYGGRCCGVSGAAFGVEGASGRGRDGVEAEKVGSLTLNAGEEAFGTAGFLGVGDLGERCLAGDFDSSQAKAGGGEHAPGFGVRGEAGVCGEIGRDSDCNAGGENVVARLGVGTPVGVFTVRDKEASRSKENLLA